MNENKRSHLEMLQGVVNRLSQNSFLLKGWSVVLVSALMALATKESKPGFIFLAYLPVFSFWLLDGFFLRQEKLFRALYDYVRTLDEDKIDFSMDTSIVKDKVDDFAKVSLSRTLVIFHGVILLTIIIVMIFLIIKR